DADRLLFQELAEAETRIDVLAASDRYPRMIADGCHGVDVIAWHGFLQPRRAERLDGFGDLDRAFGVVPRVAFEHQGNIGAKGLAHRADMLHYVVDLAVSDGPVPDLPGIPAACAILTLCYGVNACFDAAHTAAAHQAGRMVRIAGVEIDGDL